MPERAVKRFNTDPRESVLESWFRDRVRDLGGRAYKFTAPGRRSVPDRLIVLPGGTLFFVELKRKGGKPTAKQDVEINYLRSMGLNVYIADSKEDCNRILEKETRVGRIQ